MGEIYIHTTYPEVEFYLRNLKDATLYDVTYKGKESWSGKTLWTKEWVAIYRTNNHEHEIRIRKVAWQWLASIISDGKERATIIGSLEFVKKFININEIYDFLRGKLAGKNGEPPKHIVMEDSFLPPFADAILTEIFC